MASEALRTEPNGEDNAQTEQSGECTADSSTAAKELYEDAGTEAETGASCSHRRRRRRRGTLTHIKKHHPVKHIAAPLPEDKVHLAILPGETRVQRRKRLARERGRRCRQKRREQLRADGGEASEKPRPARRYGDCRDQAERARQRRLAGTFADYRTPAERARKRRLAKQRRLAEALAENGDHADLSGPSKAPGVCTENRDEAERARQRRRTGTHADYRDEAERSRQRRLAGTLCDNRDQAERSRQRRAAGTHADYRNRATDSRRRREDAAAAAGQGTLPPYRPRPRRKRVEGAFTMNESTIVEYVQAYSGEVSGATGALEAPVGRPPMECHFRLCRLCFMFDTFVGPAPSDQLCDHVCFRCSKKKPELEPEPQREPEMELDVKPEQQPKLETEPERQLKQEPKWEREPEQDESSTPHTSEITGAFTPIEPEFTGLWSTQSTGQFEEHGLQRHFHSV